VAECSGGIVILGVPRSGTTLLRRLLNAHDDIVCPGETFLLTAAARFLRGDDIVDGIDYGVLGGLQSAGFEEKEILDRVRHLVFGFLDEIAARAGKRRWAVKTAIDSFYVQEIEKICAPSTRFVVLLRHGLDTALSLQDLCAANEVYIRELHEYIRRYPRPLEAFAHAWADVTASLLDFESRTDGAMLVKYENLVDEPEETMRMIAEHLGESWCDGLIDRALGDHSVAGLGDWKTYSRAAIDTTSVGRFEALSEALISRLAPIVNPMLLRCGYDCVPGGSPGSAQDAMRRYELAMMFNASRSKR
jgi:protein-tyrosine sulfotransferase